MTSHTWQPGTFEIATAEGRQTVEGLTCGPFGIRLEPRRRPLWTVTHLASGRRATPGGAGFSHQAIAMAFVERLLPLADDTALADRVVAIWNELITRDTVALMEHHFGHMAAAS